MRHREPPAECRHFLTQNMQAAGIILTEQCPINKTGNGVHVRFGQSARGQRRRTQGECRS